MPSKHPTKNKPGARKRRLNNGASAWALQERIGQELIGTDEDCLIYRWQIGEDGKKFWGPSWITQEKRGSRERFSHLEYTRTWRHPWPEKLAMDEIRWELMHFCESERNLWSGVANFGAACALAKVEDVWASAPTDVRQYFEEAERHGRIEHIFSVVEHTTRRKGRLRKGRDGKLRYHVHVHFLLIALDGQDLTQARWYTAFLERFGKGSSIERVKGKRGKRSKRRLVNYLLKPLERVDLLEHGEYYGWCKAVRGLRRYSVYGAFKKCLKRREALNQRVVPKAGTKKLTVKQMLKKPKSPRPKSSRGPAPVLPNSLVRTKRRKNAQGEWEEWDLIRNFQSPPAHAPRKASDPAAAILYSRYHSQIPQSSNACLQPASPTSCQPAEEGMSDGLSSGSPPRAIQAPALASACLPCLEEQGRSQDARPTPPGEQAGADAPPPFDQGAGKPDECAPRQSKAPACVDFHPPTQKWWKAWNKERAGAEARGGKEQSPPPAEEKNAGRGPLWGGTLRFWGAAS